MTVLLKITFGGLKKSKNKSFFFVHKNVLLSADFSTKTKAYVPPFKTFKISAIFMFLLE